MAVQITITLPNTHTVRRADKTEVIVIDFSKLPANVIEAAIPVAFATMLLNTYNGGGKEATATEKQAKVDKKLAAWYRGELNVTTRGDATVTLMRECYRSQLEAQLGKMSDKAWQAFQVDSLKAAKLEVPKGAVDFDDFIRARAIIGGDESKADAMLAKWEVKANELAAERATTLATIDVSAITF